MLIGCARLELMRAVVALSSGSGEFYLGLVLLASLDRRGMVLAARVASIDGA
jgi:hypothetical protein